MTDLPTSDWRLAVYGSRGSNPAQSRRGPRKVDRDRVLATQGDTCLYCGIPIGTTIRKAIRVRRGYLRIKEVTLRRNWDHFVPYAYSLQNPGTGWVLACHVCNSIKRARMYDTVDDARAFILLRREELGYEAARIARLESDLQSALPAAAEAQEELDVRSLARRQRRPTLDPDTLTEAEVAALAGISKHWLSILRSRGQAPAWRWNMQGVVYSRASANEWIKNRAVRRKSCPGKVPFFVEHVAQQRAREIRQSDGHDIHAYRCTACGWWHLDHGIGQTAGA